MILGAMLFGGAAATAPPLSGPEPAASAIENMHGPGVNWGNGIHIYGAGAFIVGGKFVYCVEPWIRSGPHIPDFIGTGTIPGNSSDGVSVAPTSGAPLQQITYLMERYGQTNDNVQAAAVALAIWEIRGADGRGNSGYESEVAKVRRSVGPAVVALSQQLMAEAVWWLQPSSSTVNATDAPIIMVNAEHPYRGTVSVPTGTLSLHIENGAFPDGSTSRSWDGLGAPPGTSLSWQGLPPADHWDKFYRVTFSGSYLATPDTVLWGDGNGWQASITNVEPQVKPLRAAYADIDTAWAPQVASEVTSKFVSVGERHSDDVIFSAAPAGSGFSGEWRWRMNSEGAREWMPVKARVTAYGPFLTDPALNPSAEPPVGAPVAARATLTTDPARDHSAPQRYSFVFDEAIAEQGYYTYVWEIDGSDQDPSITGADGCTTPNAELGCRVLSQDYYFTDGFGAVNETQVGKMDQHFSTKLSTHETSLDGSFTDDIIIPDMQNWLRGADGARLPLTFTGTAYLVPGTVDGELAQSVTVPTDAIELATVRVTTDPAQNGQRLTSEAISIPVSTSREYSFVTMRWCILDEDQDPSAQGFWEQRCDDFGVPEESARILHPEVRTEAVPEATVYDELADKAIVNGPIPEHTELVFELFKQPEPGDPKFGPDGSPTDIEWTQVEVDGFADDAVCEPENRVARTEAIPVDAGTNESARYHSPEVRVTAKGTYWWIESLIHRDPGTGTETLILAGECGLPDETTRVDSPQVTTQATESAFVGDPVRDTAVVTGPLPHADTGVQAELTFQVFKRHGESVVCDASNLVFDLTEPVPVAAVGEYESAEVKFDEAGDYFWVETLSYVFESGDREVVHTGECGLPNETTKVRDRPALAATGAGDGLSALLWGGVGSGGLLLAIGLSLLLHSRRRPTRKIADRAQSEIRECSG